VEPSFAYKIAEAKRRQRHWMAMGRRSAGHRLLGKVQAFEFFDRHDVRRPRLLHHVDGLDQLQQHHLAQPCVIKPAAADGSKGVLALQPEEPGYRSILRGHRHLTWEEVVDHLAGQQAEYGFEDAWLIEELLRPTDGELRVPHDYKFYAFRGTVGLILQRQVAPRGYKWWTADWEPTRVGKYDAKIDDRLPPPVDPDVMSATVARVSAAIPLPFMRIDVFDADDGVTFGELTPHPGGYADFDADTDRFLGELYERAEAAWTVPVADPPAAPGHRSGATGQPSRSYGSTANTSRRLGSTLRRAARSLRSTRP
jgi:hypothetical protein